jgi:hypothetical protein
MHALVIIRTRFVRDIPVIQLSQKPMAWMLGEVERKKSSITAANGFSIQIPPLLQRMV